MVWKHESSLTNPPNWYIRRILKLNLNDVHPVTGMMLLSRTIPVILTRLSGIQIASPIGKCTFPNALVFPMFSAAKTAIIPNQKISEKNIDYLTATNQRKDNFSPAVKCKRFGASSAHSRLKTPSITLLKKGVFLKKIYVYIFFFLSILYKQYIHLNLFQNPHFFFEKHLPPSFSFFGLFSRSPAEPTFRFLKGSRWTTIGLSSASSGDSIASFVHTKKVPYDVDGQNPSKPPRMLSILPIIYSVLTIPGGCLGFLNHQQYDLCAKKIETNFVVTTRIHDL